MIVYYGIKRPRIPLPAKRLNVKMFGGMWFFLASFCLVFRSSFAANAALFKNVTAEHSCGVNRTELYYNITMANLLPFLRNISTCDQSDTKYAHPPKYMVDGNPYTFWQSEGSRDDARITIDLSGPKQKFYYINNIAIKFGHYYPPSRIAFYKRSSGTEQSSFQPWHYLVTERGDCEERFGVPYQEIAGVANSTLCTTYGKEDLKTNENVEVRLQGGRGYVVFPGTKKLNTLLLDFMKTSAVEIRFSGLRLFYDRLANRWQHYVVNEVEVNGYCDCNGQADGLNCPYDEATGDRKCVCQEGACGEQCDRCCPAYKQYPFKAGQKGPFIKDKDAACEKCNCYGHSDTCEYNATVANNNCTYDNNATNDECSMDIYGKYSGGGVCLNCQDNTEGINCQRCSTEFYRESGKSHRNKDACQPCNCDRKGTSNITRNGVEKYDCVRDDEEAVKLIDLAPGDCLCKNKTTGRQCDRCRDGYYNLTAQNPEGCLDCNCHTNGTVNGSIVCSDDGACLCKQYVEGMKCRHCKSGTFNLANSNQDGCTKCICSGITNNCTSSSLYIIETNYNVSGWKLTSGRDGNDILPHMNIQEEVDGQSIDMISANISTEQTLYWMADKDYFGGKSLVEAYGGNIEFTRKVSVLPNGTLETSAKVILKGPRNVTLQRRLPDLVNGSSILITLSVKMVEFLWTYHDSNITVDRSTFMLVLSKVDKIWITASYFTSGPGTYQTSFGNFRLRSASSKPTGNGLAVDVEQCSCGDSYQGLSCERCAPGYHRVNVSGHPFFGICVPCNCHGHTLDCNPDTGECLNCDHNTTGIMCELCKDGFYGDATNGTSDDCRKCPCEPPRTTTDLCALLSNGSVQCLNCSQGYEKNLECKRCELGYFGTPYLPGGNCSLCQCNNNSDICDRKTGSCLGYCENNATGWHCERCENGTHGEATKQQCQACTCNVTGSYHEPCNHMTGQCHCKPNVQGLNCSACDPNHYGFNASGCHQCGCNQFGSRSLQCNMYSGICTCKNFTRGEKCDSCMDGYYGLPNATCRDCGCNSTGSNTSVCDHHTGQCSCKSGVEGRKCDRCKVQHKNFSSEGCEPCPRCTMKLQSRVDEAAEVLSKSEKDAGQADQSMNLYDSLKDLERKIPNVQAQQESYSNRIERLKYYRQELSNTTLNVTLMNLEKQEEELIVKANFLNRSLSQERERNENLSNLSKSALEFSNAVQIMTQDVASELSELVNQTTIMNDSSSNAAHLLERRILEARDEQQREKDTAKMVDGSFKDTENAKEEIKNQTNEMASLHEAIDQFRKDLNVTNQLIETGMVIRDATLRDIGDIKKLVALVDSTLKETAEALRRTSSYINESKKLNAEGEANYKKIENISLPELHLELENLKISLDNVNASLVTARKIIANASQHAKDLTAEAEGIARNFSAARRHGEKAVKSIERYNEVTEKIKNSAELSKQANAAVNELIGRIHNLTRTSEDLNKKVSLCQNLSSAILATTLARNLNIQGLSSNVSEADQTFSQANETCQKVEKSLITFNTQSGEMMNVATVQGSLIHGYLRNSSHLASESNKISDGIKMKTIELKKRLNKANETLSAVNFLVVNASYVAERTQITINKTDQLLFNITQSTNASRQILQKLERTQQNLTARMKRIEAKLKSAREKVAKFRLAMQLRGNTSVQYRPTQRLVSNPLLNIISLDFKTNFSTGLLLYMAPNPNSTYQIISLKLVSNFVRFTYNLGSSPTVITNWEVPVAHNTWHRVYATRYRKNARLTVTNLESGFFRTYDEGPTRIYPELELNFNENSSVFLGGLATSQKVNFTERYFAGVLDNFVLNEETVPLWQPVAVEGIRRFTRKRTKQENYDSCVTFHGNGFIQQRAGTFETRTNSSLSFQFRSFFKDADLVIVEGKDKELIYKVSLSDGRIIFQYNETTLASNNSYYNDGLWYDVSVSRTLKNATLRIMPLNLGTRRQEDYVTVTRTLPLYLPFAEYVYFGGKNDSGNRFAGGMKIVSLSSIITNKPVRRKLNDVNSTVLSKGVNFDKCLGQIAKGLHYSSGYTALRTDTITSIKILKITFKTNEPSGLLAYSIKEEIRFYVALFHGNIILMYVNGTAPELILQTDTESLNDGAYHTVDIEITNSKIGMNVDTRPSDNPLSKSLPDDIPGPVPLADLLYIAGTPSSVTIPLLVPILLPFNGDIQSVVLNQNTVLEGSSLSPFMSGVSERVSAAGVTPPLMVIPTQAPTNTPAPPTCGTKYPEKVFSEKQQEVHFQGNDSVLGLSPNKSLLDGMGDRFVVVLEFRALSPNGLLFLAVDNVTNPSQFVSLELVDGSLVYQFNSGVGLVRLKTEANYAIGGLWYTVNLLRINQLGIMVVRENKEYHKARGDNTTAKLLVVNSVFIGGTPVINASMLVNPSAPSFFGCIRKLSIETSPQYKLFNLSGEAVPGQTKNVQPGQCYDYVQPQVGFDGTGYAKLRGIYHITKESEVNIRFRTTKRNGILFVAMDTNGSDAMVLEQVNGQIILSYLLTGLQTTLEWTHPNITSPAEKNTSYALCDNIYHTINVKRSPGLLRMDVNSNNEVKVNVSDDSIVGTVYIGGIPSGLGVNIGSTRRRLVGCVESVTINGHMVDFKHDLADHQSVEFGCRAPVEPQKTYSDFNPLQVFTFI